MTDTQVRSTIDQLPHDAELGAEAPQPDHIAVLALRLQHLNPHASPSMVQRSIDDAIATFSGARVQQFLPILIERTASAALRLGAGPAEDAGAMPRRACGPPS